MVKPVVVLLSKDFHTKQSSLSPNVVHGWLQALAACEPAPKLPAALLKYLTKTFNAWHLTVPMLGAHTLHLPAEAQAFDTLLELHETLNDAMRSVRCGAARSACRVARRWRSSSTGRGRRRRRRTRR